MAAPMLTSRERILALLTEEPGLHLRELPRRLGISLRAVRYHLDTLGDEAVVTPHRSGRFERWFPARTFSADERALISALRVRGQRAILTCLLKEGPATVANIKKATRLAAPALHRDLDYLAADRLIEVGSERLYRLHDLDRTRMRLAMYRQRYPDLLADAAQEIFEETR